MDASASTGGAVMMMMLMLMLMRRDEEDEEEDGDDLPLPSGRVRLASMLFFRLITFVHAEGSS